MKVHMWYMYASGGFINQITADIGASIVSGVFTIFFRSAITEGLSDDLIHYTLDTRIT